MGIGKSKKAIGAFIGVVAVVLLGTQAGGAFERKSGIWQVMRAGHFSGPMNEEADVRPIKGSIVAKGKRYKFWEYYWEEKRPSGHGRTLLLVFERADKALSYLGCYEFEGSDFHGIIHPEIRGQTVFFPYKDIEIMGVKFNKEISFENGPPPLARVGDGDSGEFLR
jgi:hypothetical protein